MDVNKKLIDEHSFKKIRANYLKKLGLTSNYFYVCTYFCLVFLPQPRQVCELVQLTFKSNSSYSINALFCEQKMFRQTWHLQTRSASRARTSTIFPLPSSPHCPPRTTDTHGLVILRLQVSLSFTTSSKPTLLCKLLLSHQFTACRGKGFDTLDEICQDELDARELMRQNINLIPSADFLKLAWFGGKQLLVQWDFMWFHKISVR